MKNLEKRQQLVDLNQKIKKAQELYKKLASEMLPKIGSETITVDNFNIIKKKKTTYKLKSYISEKELCKKYPEYVKFDLTSFKNDNKAIVDEVAEKNVTEYLYIKKR